MQQLALARKSVNCLGDVPATRRRSLLVLTAAEREDISRGLASDSQHNPRPESESVIPF
jgi:hypothetical protein